MCGPQHQAKPAASSNCPDNWGKREPSPYRSGEGTWDLGAGADQPSGVGAWNVHAGVVGTGEVHSSAPSCGGGSTPAYNR